MQLITYIHLTDIYIHIKKISQSPYPGFKKLNLLVLGRGYNNSNIQIIFKTTKSKLQLWQPLIRLLTKI